MKNNLKKLLVLTSVFGIVAALGGCSDSSKPMTESVKYIETHQHDTIRNVSAKMYQLNNDKIGTIGFKESETGLKMTVDMKDLRPDTEYKLYVYDMKDATNKDEMKKMDVKLPTLTADKNGIIDDNFMIIGLTAAKLKYTTITLNRDNENKDDVKVGFGVLE